MKEKIVVKDGKYIIPALEGLPPPRIQPWTDAEVQALKRYYRKVETARLAKALGRTVSAVRMKAQALGIRGSR